MLLFLAQLMFIVWCYNFFVYCKLFQDISFKHGYIPGELIFWKKILYMLESHSSQMRASLLLIKPIHQQREIPSSLYSLWMDPLMVENSLPLGQQFVCVYMNSIDNISQGSRTTKGIIFLLTQGTKKLVKKSMIKTVQGSVQFSPVTQSCLTLCDICFCLDGDCSHEIKRCLFLGRKVMNN